MSNKKGPYLLKFWGRGSNELYNDPFFQHMLLDVSLSSLKDNDSYYIWFDSEFNVQVVEYNIAKLELENNWNIVSVRYIQGYDEFGRMVKTEYRTIAHMTLILPNGSKFAYSEDFGYGYPAEAAEYMFEDGNYSCDCNRSLFLQNIGVDIQQLNCGDTIQMEDFRIVYED